MLISNMFFMRGEIKPISNGFTNDSYKIDRYSILN